MNGGACIIPARGGSKRVPRKNIRPFCGKPMIAWPIEAAQVSGCFDRIIVSTDDEEIAEVARQWGAEVPFMRPAELADDHTGTVAVIADTIARQRELGLSPTHVCCVYATAPFVSPEDLRCGLDLLQQNDCDYVFSATTYAFPIQRAIRITSIGRAQLFYPEHLNTRSQDLEPSYHDAGQFYWGRASAWVEERPVLGTASIPFLLPRFRVQDIDTPEDWEHAERMFDTIRTHSG